MSTKHWFSLFLVCLTSIAPAQHHYLCYDQSISAFKLLAPDRAKFNRFEGKYTGGSVQFACNNRHSLGIGLGLNSIHYQKEWQGTFPESNSFGVASVDGRIDYWSFPLSYNYVPGKAYRGPGRHYRYGRDRFRFGFSLTYMPSFQGASSFSVATSGGADPAVFLSTFSSNEQHFQHSFTIGLNDQVLFAEKHLRLELEPYAGIGSGYFKESGTKFTTVSYGLKIRIGLWAKLPRISIEKEIDRGNAEDKKKLLEKKQKEIEEQLNKKPN